MTEMAAWIRRATTRLLRAKSRSCAVYSSASDEPQRGQRLLITISLKTFAESPGTRIVNNEYQKNNQRS